MAVFNSFSWTGRGDSSVAERIKESNENLEVLRRRGEAARNIPVPAVARSIAEVISEKPYVPIKYEPVSMAVDGYSEEQLAEYAEIASVVGVSPVDMIVEEFKAYLRKQDFPVYDLKTVVKFMDEKSLKEGNGWGWNWLPLREKDRIEASFGTSARRREMNTWNGAMTGEDRAASDQYSSHRFGGGAAAWPTEIYSKVVPLHALKKVAKIEKEFRHQVAFMVCDYAPAPAFKSDPFLMAVVKNNRLHEGYGRFVIDVWDEPGFGLEHMLKSGL